MEYFVSCSAAHLSFMFMVLFSSHSNLHTQMQTCVFTLYGHRACSCSHFEEYMSSWTEVFVVEPRLWKITSSVPDVSYCHVDASNLKLFVQ